MPVRKHDWILAEISYISAPLHKRKMRSWEKKSLTNSILKTDLLNEPELRFYAMESIKELERKVTLKTISLSFNIPYQGVRRYASQNGWRAKRVRFWIAVREGVKERLYKEKIQNHALLMVLAQANT